MNKELIIRAKELFEETNYSIDQVKNSLSEEFENFFNILLNCQGKVVFSGIGKSGHIAKKIAASYSSTGTLSIFLNPVEALHGDLGIIESKDVLVLISHSGNTNEIISLLPSLKNLGVKILSVTSNENSKLAKNSDVHINTLVKKELCPYNLAPTTSTTITLVILDIFMILLMEHKNFKKESFALFHPAGSLGKKLILKISDLIDSEPIFITKCDTFVDLIEKMSKGKKGCIPYIENEEILGLITDGDIRRAIETSGADVFKQEISSIMTKKPLIINHNTLAIDVLNMMETKNITAIPITRGNEFIGIVNIHDILKVGLKK